jgi:hypothetical protein
MRKILLGFIITLCISDSCFCQYWEPVGGGVDLQVRDIYADTTDSTLYVVGHFQYAGDSLVNRIGAWKNGVWNRIGDTGDNTCYSSNPIFSITKFNNNLFIAGGFILCPDSVNTLAEWDGNGWSNCGNPQSIYSVFMVSVINGDLFCFGIFDTISGQYIKNMARWNGILWEQFGTTPPFDLTGEALGCGDYCNGNYYFGGNFTATNGYKEIAGWDGAQWFPLQQGILGSNANIGSIKAYNGYLFVGGEFLQSDGNVSDYLMAWDGENWFNPFPNIQYDFFVRDIQIINNDLYIAGWHHVIGDTNIYGLAKYDGTNFFSIGGANNFITKIAGLNDTLYAATEGICDGDTGKWIAQMPINTPIDTFVYQPLAIQSFESTLEVLNIFPNPSNEFIKISINEEFKNISYVILNMLGEKVLMGCLSDSKGQIHIGYLPNGIYIMEIIIDNKRFPRNY